MAQLPSLAQACALDPRARDALLRSEGRIVVVGAGGWIGRALLRGLHEALGAESFAARVAAFGSSARDVDLGDGLSVAQRPLGELHQLPAAPTALFHLAFLTMDKVGGMPRDEYIAANRKLSQAVLEALAPIGADRLFVASSGAAAFADAPDANEALALYGRLKRDDEDLFAAWAEADPARRAVVTRIYSLSGPFINKHEVYALASFINDALAGRTITVRAPIRVVRSYVAIRELMSLALVQLLSPEGPRVRRYDTGGVASELEEVASAVAGVLGGSVERAAITGDQTNLYAGDQDVYSGLLSEAGIAPVALEQQILETATSLASEGTIFADTGAKAG